MDGEAADRSDREGLTLATSAAGGECSMIGLRAIRSLNQPNVEDGLTPGAIGSVACRLPPRVGIWGRVGGTVGGSGDFDWSVDIDKSWNFEPSRSGISVSLSIATYQLVGHRETHL